MRQRHFGYLARVICQVASPITENVERKPCVVALVSVWRVIVFASVVPVIGFLGRRPGKIRPVGAEAIADLLQYVERCGGQWYDMIFRLTLSSVSFYGLSSARTG